MSTFYTQVSSPLYCAPEIRNSVSYTESIDIWGLGVILFTMLYGSMKSYELPTDIQEKCDVLQDIIIKNCEDFNEECYEFISCLLSNNPEERPTASECNSYKWMSSD